MNKAEYIAKYGEDAYKRQLNLSRIYCLRNRKRKSELHKQWRHENKEYYNNSRKNRRSMKRENGKTIFCRENYELIENYKLAKTDNFNPKKWHLHHRLENYYSSRMLIRKGLYYNLNPEALIWLPADEHKSDLAISARYPELSKWHQRKLENE